MLTNPDDQPPSPAADPSDLAELVSKAAEGDAESWAEITDRFTTLVWAIARSHQLSADDSADVVQMTWLRLIESLPTVRAPGSTAGLARRHRSTRGARAARAPFLRRSLRQPRATGNRPRGVASAISARAKPTVG